MKEKDITRFWSKVDVGEEKECWHWKFGKDTDGYGQFYLEGKNVKASIFAYTVYNNKKPSFFVCHSCDNPSCCNPNHLFEGTHDENMKDMSDKKRKKGHRLNQEEVLDILRKHYRQGLSGTEIACIYKTNRSPIYDVINGRTWKEIFNQFKKENSDEC